MEVDMVFRPFADTVTGALVCVAPDAEPPVAVDEPLPHAESSATRAAAPAALSPLLPIPRTNICHLTSGSGTQRVLLQKTRSRPASGSSGPWNQMGSRNARRLHSGGNAEAGLWSTSGFQPPRSIP